jgi:hypothetical protein
MKWYDYIACLFFADTISASLLSGNIFILSVAIFGYVSYESMRKEDNNAMD